MNRGDGSLAAQNQTRDPGATAQTLGQDLVDAGPGFNLAARGEGRTREEVGSTGLNLDEKTVWVTILVYQFQFLQLVCTDQTMVQRYLAIKTDKEARRGFLLGTALTIPVWLYFSFIGTALYVFYKNFSTPH